MGLCLLGHESFELHLPESSWVVLGPELQLCVVQKAGNRRRQAERSSRIAVAERPPDSLHLALLGEFAAEA